MTLTLIIIAAFVCAAALAGAVIVMLSGGATTQVEDRLDMFTATPASSAAKKAQESTSILMSPLNEVSNPFVDFFSRFGNLEQLLAQADLGLTPTRFLLVSAGSAGAAFLICMAAPISKYIAPAAAIFGGMLPLLVVMFLRKRRIKKFGKQLPEALELISRALRAGHSLGAGISLVADEMADPIRKEFCRCYEEQNLGIPLEVALDSMTMRVPNLDLRFFATAVILQRQTGGDLAEILDKIGHLVRERFKIWGQIQALTGEGRLSGIVLLALPPVLFLVMYHMNRNYVLMLFTDPMGQQMLVGAIIMQLFGALVIKKIVNIKV